MVYTGTLCTEAEIVVFAGENVDVTGDTEANRNLLVAQAEDYVNSLSRFDWVTNVATITAAARQVLAEFCARYTAVALITYNMAGYSSRVEAEDMLNISLFRMNLLQKLIEESKWVTFAGGKV